MFEKKLRLNNIIKVLTFSDSLIVSAWGLVNPLFAVFVTKQIQDGGVELVGLSVAVYWLARASMQIPFAKLIDSVKGEIDDFIIMAIGTTLISLVPFAFMFVTRPGQVVFFQGLTGFASAMVSPGWLAIFTRHIDKHTEAEEWGVYNATVGFGIALAGALSGFLVEKFGFRTLYFIVGCLCTLGSTFLFFVYQDLRKEEKNRG